MKVYTISALPTVTVTSCETNQPRNYPYEWDIVKNVNTYLVPHRLMTETNGGQYL